VSVIGTPYSSGGMTLTVKDQSTHRKANSSATSSPICDMIYFETANGLTSGGISTAHIYTQTKHRTTQRNKKPRMEHA